MAQTSANHIPMIPSRSSHGRYTHPFFVTTTHTGGEPVDNRAHMSVGAHGAHAIEEDVGEFRFHALGDSRVGERADLASRRWRMSPMIKMLAFPLALVLTTATIGHSQERVGTSREDAPSYSGAFSIENETGVTIRYEVRWGSDRPWKTISLSSGHIETHRYPLGEDRNAKVPTPYVRFDRIGGDGRFTPKEYRMEFYAVGHGGYGSRPNNTEPKKYYFKYGADGRSLDILAR